MLKKMNLIVMSLLVICIFIFLPKPIFGNDDKDTTLYYSTGCSIKVKYAGGAPYDPIVKPPVVGEFDPVPYTLIPAYSKEFNRNMELILQGKLSITELMDGLEKLHGGQSIWRDELGHEVLKPVAVEVEKAVCKGSRWDNFKIRGIGHIGNYITHDNDNYIFNYKKPFMAKSSFMCGKVKVEIRTSSNGIYEYSPVDRMDVVHIVLSDDTNKEDFFIFDAEPVLSADCSVDEGKSELYIKTSYAPWRFGQEIWENEYTVTHIFHDTKYFKTFDDFANKFHMRSGVDPNDPEGTGIYIPNLIVPINDGKNYIVSVRSITPVACDSTSTRTLNPNFMLLPVPQRPGSF